MNLGDQFWNFKANTTIGEIDFHDWIGNDSWAILFSHPADFTPVCTTELAQAARLNPQFIERNVKLIALSCDSVDSHREWIKDIQAYGKISEFPFPIIDDEKRELAVKLNMLDKDEIGSKGLPLTCRAVFIIDSKKKLRASLLYPASSGRNFDEILRLVDSLQLTDRNKVATPVDWQKGNFCMVLPTVSNEDIPKLYPKGVENIQVPSGKCYMRKTYPE